MNEKKNHSRPLPPPRGRKILKYDEIENLNISIFQLFDQMERNFQRRISGSEDEGRQFHQALEQRINKLRTEIPVIDLIEETQGSQENQIKEDEDILLKNLNQIVELYRKRQTDKQEVLQKLKNEINEEMRQRFITDEYIQITKEIDRLKKTSHQVSESEKENMSSSIEEEDRITESTPLHTHTLRTSTYSASRKILQAEEKHKKIDKDIKTKRRQLKELENQIKVRSEELEIKEQEFDFKKNQIEQLHQEIAEKNKVDAIAQTEEDTEEYSIVSGSANDDSVEPTNQSTPIKTYKNGQNQLELDFIRFGRKVWNDKDVKNFLRTYKNIHSSQTTPKRKENEIQLNIEKLVIDISATIKTIYHGAQELLEELKKYNDKINMEIELIKASRNKYMTLQAHHVQYMEEAIAVIKRLQTYCDEQIDKLQSTYYDLNVDNLDSLKNQIIRKIESQFETQIDRIQEMIENDKTKKPNKIQDLKPTNQQIKKLILVPNNTQMEVTQISKILRD